MDVFTKDFYRDIVHTIIKSRPKKGYGQLSKMAKYIGVNTTFVSQIMSGAKEPSLEQAVRISEFLHLNESETEYFLLLVQKERAGSQALLRILNKQIISLKNKNAQISKKVSKYKSLSSSDSAVFYSDWVYSAVRQACAIDEYGKSSREIADRLGLSEKRVLTVLQFLTESGLVNEGTNGYSVGLTRTHLSPHSPWIKSYHTNWRMRAVEKAIRNETHQVHYTSPMTLAREDVVNVHQKLLEVVKDIGGIIDPSPSEEIYCLNLDWFKV